MKYSVYEVSDKLQLKQTLMYSVLQSTDNSFSVPKQNKFDILRNRTVLFISWIDTHKSLTLKNNSSANLITLALFIYQ